MTQHAWVAIGYMISLLLAIPIGNLIVDMLIVKKKNNIWLIIIIAIGVIAIFFAFLNALFPDITIHDLHGVWPPTIR